MKRRNFLIGTGMAATAALAGGVCISNKTKATTQQKNANSIGVALVGLGYYSRDLLAPALQQTQHCHLAAIVTGSPEKIPIWQKKYGIKDQNVYNYANMYRIADNPEIDVVYIVLPTGLHAAFATLAANAGKHLWCEKPMARTEAECQLIIDACRRNKVKLSIGYRMQHEPNTQKIIKWATTQPFGSIQKITAAAGYNDTRTHKHWKLIKGLGGGAMYDMGVYPLNAVRYATGLEPIAATARHVNTRKELFAEVDETTHFNLEFPRGIIAECTTSFGQNLNELNVVCDKGSYGLNPFQAYSGIKGKASDGTLFNASIPNQQAKQMDDNALAILNNTDVLVPGEEGMKDIRIVEAIYKAAKSGERVEL